jgi:hypothetical protein
MVCWSQFMYDERCLQNDNFQKTACEMCGDFLEFSWVILPFFA